MAMPTCHLAAVLFQSLSLPAAYVLQNPLGSLLLLCRLAHNWIRRILLMVSICLKQSQQLYIPLVELILSPHSLKY